MRKFTRRHYNKKLVALGMSAFMGIGLTSTGFAAWVMSKDTEKAPEGNVIVSTITDVNMEITVEQASIGSFIFDAARDDNVGRIQWDGENFENLSITIKGTVTNSSIVHIFYEQHTDHNNAYHCKHTKSGRNIHDWIRAS